MRFAGLEVSRSKALQVSGIHRPTIRATTPTAGPARHGPATNSKKVIVVAVTGPVIEWWQHRVPLADCVRHGGVEPKDCHQWPPGTATGVVALSLQLAQAHQELRRRIELLKAGFDQPQPARTLRTHCLAFCAALTSHHQGEDGGLFADLLRQRPDLSGTIAKLVEDHEMIASILARVAEIGGQISGSAGSAPESIRRELDGLTAIMESHFAYEERAIGAALDGGVSDSGWSDLVFRFRPAPH